MTNTYRLTEEQLSRLRRAELLARRDVLPRFRLRNILSALVAEIEASAHEALPADLRECADGSVACSHQDVTCCPACAAAHVALVAVGAVHFWISDPVERVKLGGSR